MAVDCFRSCEKMNCKSIGTIVSEMRQAKMAARNAVPATVIKLQREVVDSRGQSSLAFPAFSISKLRGH